MLVQSGQIVWWPREKGFSVDNLYMFLAFLPYVARGAWSKICRLIQNKSMAFQLKEQNNSLNANYFS